MQFKSALILGVILSSGAFAQQSTNYSAADYKHPQLVETQKEKNESLSNGNDTFYESEVANYKQQKATKVKRKREFVRPKKSGSNVSYKHPQGL